MTTFWDFCGRVMEICIKNKKPNPKSVALNPVITVQPQRTILISLNFNVLLWDHEGHDNYLPRIPFVQGLVSCKNTFLFLCQEKWEVNRLGLFLQEHIRLLNSVEILELVCYLA